MLNRRDRHRRHGVTLIELLVVMVVGGIALGLVASISVRHQRIFADLADAGALSGQLRDAAAILPIDLRSAATGAGDLREARDTSIELRGTIASAVVCDTTASSLTLAPAVLGSTTFGSYLTPIEVGDTAWVLVPDDTVDAWRPFRVSAVSSATVGSCSAYGPKLGDTDRMAARTSIALEPRPSFAGVVGAPLRVTRPLRYSLYHASDGAWYLGEKDWNNATARFNTIQPVSGPFLSAASGGLRFRYLDSVGADLAVPVGDARTIAAVQVEMRGQTRNNTRVLGAAAASGKRSDSTSVSVLLHNRR